MSERERERERERNMQHKQPKGGERCNERGTMREYERERGNARDRRERDM